MSNKKRTDKVLIIDLECTCWEKYTEDLPQREIIEIGVCEILNGDHFEIGRKKQYFVRPVNGQISEYCYKLTGISQEMVNKARYLNEVLKEFHKDFYPDRFLWCSWGDFDRFMFETECYQKYIKYPLSSRHLNLKTMHSVLNNIPKECSLQKALNFYRINFEGIPHCGADDAYNTAKVFIKLFEKYKIKQI